MTGDNIKCGTHVKVIELWIVSATCVELGYLDSTKKIAYLNCGVKVYHFSDKLSQTRYKFTCGLYVELMLISSI